MITLGISCYYHDAAACIIKNGVVIAAAAEERFTRLKHDNSFPKSAIEFCLNSLRIGINEVDVVCFYEKPIIKLERTLYQHYAYFPKSYRVFLDTMGHWFGARLQVKKTLNKQFGYCGKISYIDHHLSHAASAYFLSPYSNSVIVTIDGVGEWSTTTIGFGKKTIKIEKEIHFPHSLGLLYSTLTTYLGFSANDAEYKVMGLAAYGNPKPFKEKFDNIIKIFDDGSFQLNMEYFDFSSADHMASEKLSSLFGYPQRLPESDVQSHHQDIAAALQEKLEEAVFTILKQAAKNHPSCTNLCFSGGVALNSVLNGKILKHTAFTHLFIPPDPGDAGGAMGAALWTSNSLSSERTASKTFTPYLGPDFSWHKILQAIRKYKLKYTFFADRKELLAKTADLLVRHKVIGWFQGKMEWGPRALGNRSILASADNINMKEIINSRVKHRELFRPFAPVIQQESAEEYFETDKRLPISAKWMLMVYPFREKMKKNIPATVHVDGSGRLQTLERKDNPLFYDLLSAYKEKTGVPSFINTSFNVRGEPIVCTPEDAIKCFLATDIDVLVIDQYMIRKTKHD